MYSFESFQEKINNLYPEEKLKVIEFKGVCYPCTIECLKCHSLYTLKQGRNFLINKKRVCGKCQGKESITREIKQKVQYVIDKSDLIVIKPFSLISEDMIFKCPKCLENFNRKPRIFLQTQKCPYCESRSKTKPLSVFETDLKKKYGDEYKILGEYKNAHTKTLFEHTPCGFKWQTTPNIILNKAPCPRCKKQSRGEKNIEIFLKDRKIIFESQKRFKDLPNLSYDFYLSEYNMLIEYQGEQHYQPIPHFGGEEKFKYQQENDKKKREYAKNNNYTLLEIKYTDYKNINSILIKALQLNE